MQSETTSIGSIMMLAILGFAVLISGTRALAQQETVLHSFDPAAKDGSSIYMSVVLDRAGNVYGTTEFGGTNRGGTAFELIKSEGWTENILHNFVYATASPYEPLGGLIFDNAGNLYGTGNAGGAGGLGAVYELTQSGGIWTETIIHSFSLGVDGQYPYGNLIFDAAGNLYGTTSQGNGSGGGTVYELSPKAAGGWTEKILHGFNLDSKDGSFPLAGLTMDAKGNLYGTTAQGGSCSYSRRGCGTVFELTPGAGGVWTEKVLHNFGIGTGNDGYHPAAGVILDTAGNLYGTTPMGGKGCSTSSGCGTVYELMPNPDGSWTEVPLHYFGVGNDGVDPEAGLIFDSAGNLYGTTYIGGANGKGTVFELMPSAGGGWTEKLLHSFSGKDGEGPEASLVLVNGILYGTTSYGGDYRAGTVFQITP